MSYATRDDYPYAIQYNTGKVCLVFGHLEWKAVSPEEAKKLAKDILSILSTNLLEKE